MDTIKLKRGPRRNLPAILELGEPAFCYDTGEFFIGSGDGVIPVVGTTVFIGEDPPLNTHLIWINDKDEEFEAHFNSQILDHFQRIIDTLTKRIDTVEYVFSHELDAGFFSDKKPILPSQDVINNGNIGHISIKRGNKADLKGLLDGEMGYCKDTKELFIGNSGAMDKVGSEGSGGGSGGVDIDTPIDYLLFRKPNGEIAKVSIDDTNNWLIENHSITPPPPDPDPDPGEDLAWKYKGLIINQIYAGGQKNCENTPVSHGFVELYNTTDKPLDLEGLSLQHAITKNIWDVLPLTGVVPAKCSFTIRCAQHSSLFVTQTRLKVVKFDMEWNLALSDVGVKMFLRYGKTPLDVANPFNIHNTVDNFEKAKGYIDLVGVAPYVDPYARQSRLHDYRTGVVTVDGFEGELGQYISKNRAVHRVDFKDTDNNKGNMRSLDYTVVDPAIYGPRTVSDGPWNLYFDKTKLIHGPSMINMTFGKTQSTRCFTWQSHVTADGELLYKRTTDADFTRVDSIREVITHPDTTATVHRVILRNLQPGSYIYKVKAESLWSKNYTFTVADNLTDTSSFEFVQITDQQGWSRLEYEPWGHAMNIINNKETYDFLIETGDMSQNGNRGFEWRDYFDVAQETFGNNVCMSTVGNNDLIDKVDSLPFTYYYTFDDSPYPSVYSFDYGCVHFVCLNSNELIEEQRTWVRADLMASAKPWKIVFTHDGPYTTDRKSKLASFDAIFEECGVQLVLCGHRHYYMRSKLMYQGKEDNEKGILYVMSQATGFKSGKTRLWQSWYAVGIHPFHPCYIKWNITPEKITFNSYQITNLLPVELSNPSAAVPELLDSLEIINRNYPPAPQPTP